MIATALIPFVLDGYYVNLFIQISYFAIAALGLNILVGFTGQISLGHAAFFGFGAFASAWINNTTGIPVLLSIPLAGLMTAAVGLLFGLPAARIKGLYLAIATLAAQFILEDFFARADWFTGGSYGRRQIRSMCLAMKCSMISASSMSACSYGDHVLAGHQPDADP